MDSGSEQAELWRHPEGWTVEGQVEALAREEPVRVTYVVRCGTRWDTRSAVVEEVGPSGSRSVELQAESGRWLLNGEDVFDLHGCTDVDLGVSPSTNTLPIRRLQLAVGASAGIVAAWIRFPELDVVRAAQRYTRLAEDVYRYESGTFAADLVVDDQGLVVDYPGLWERAGAGDST